MPLPRALLITALALAFGLSGVAVAHADEWTIEDQTLASLEITKESTSTSGGAFELTVPKIGLTIKCTSESGTGELTEEAKDSDSMTLSGCKVAGAEATCTVKSPGKSAGVLSATLTTHFLEKEVGEVDKYYDEAGVTMVVEITGKGCGYPEKTEVKGTTAREVPTPGEESEERTEKFSKAITEESGVAGLVFGTNPAFLSGQNTERASGPHYPAPIGVTPVVVLPVPVEFTGGPGTTKPVKIFDNTKLSTIKLLEIGLTGPYGLFDPNTCINRNLQPFAPVDVCTVEVKCNEASQGTFFVKWEAPVSSASGKVIVLMRC